MSRVAVLLVAVLAAACAPVSPRSAGAVPDAVTVPGFSFTDKTFAFPNEIRARHPGVAGLYANYCFVLARAVRQFHAFARFDPEAPRVGHDEYERLVRAVAAHEPWAPPLPESQRIRIPGYASLRALSAAEEAAVKAGLGGRLWTLLHWTNWRVTLPLPDGHQERVLDEVLAELRQGRLVQLLVTNWPKPELNHTVVAYAYARRAAGVELTVWDPNDPSQPGAVLFDVSAERFRATRLYDTEPGPIRVFRMYYSWLL